MFRARPWDCRDDPCSVPQTISQYWSCSPRPEIRYHLRVTHRIVPLNRTREIAGVIHVHVFKQKIHAVKQGNVLGCFFGTIGCLCRCGGKKTEIGALQNVVRTKELRLNLKTGRRHKGEWEVANSTGRRQAFECVKNSCVSPHTTGKTRRQMNEGKEDLHQILS